MNQRRLNSLAAAIALSLIATGAQAAGKVDLQKQNLNQLKQQYNVAVAAKGGAAEMAHARHAQFMGADAESHLRARGIVRTGDVYAITVGEPMGQPGGTNTLKICRAA